MMSYLWILLLGSLLAAHAKAQDEAVAPVTPVPTTDATPAVNEEPEADKETESAPEEISPTVSESEPTAGPEAEVEGPVTPAENADPETTDAPAVVEGGPVTPTAGNTEIVTPVADAEPVATTQADDSEVNTPEAMLPTGEEPSPSAGTTPTQEESGPGDKDVPTPAITEEAPTDPSANEESSTSEGDIVPEDTITTMSILPTNRVPRFNLEDVLEEKTSVEERSQPEGSDSDRALRFNLEDVLEEKTSVEERSQPEGSDSDPALRTSESDAPQDSEAGSKSLAAILSGIVVCAVGAVAGYFTYQKKKLCFKNRQEADPEAAHKANAAEAQSDPQVLSNLLNSS